jgi:hypothetical protein
MNKYHQLDLKQSMRPVLLDEYEKFYQGFLDNLSNITTYDLTDIKVLTPCKFEIKSRYTGNTYEMEATALQNSKMTCTCPDHTYREHDCKHIKSFLKIAGEYMKSYHAEK